MPSFALTLVSLSLWSLILGIHLGATRLSTKFPAPPKPMHTDVRCSPPLMFFATNPFRPQCSDYKGASLIRNRHPPLGLMHRPAAGS